jgi:hypothetical protein
VSQLWRAEPTVGPIVQISKFSDPLSAYPAGPWPVELKEPVAPLEDAVELQYESNKLSAQGKFREAFFVSWCLIDHPRWDQLMPLHRV